MNQEEFLKILSEKFKDVPYTKAEYFDFDQARKHKKKRINKKWLKKYERKVVKKIGIGKKIEVKPEDYPREYFPMSDLTFVIEKSDSPIKVKYE